MLHWGFTGYLGDLCDTFLYRRVKVVHFLLVDAKRQKVVMYGTQNQGGK